MHDRKRHHRSHKHLIPGPLSRTTPQIQRMHQPHAHSTQRCPDRHHLLHPPRLHHHRPTHQREHRRRPHQRQIIHSAAYRADVQYTLEINWQVEQQHNVRAQEEELKHRRGRQYIRLLGVEPRLHHRVLAHDIHLPEGEDRGQHGRRDEQADHGAGGPGVRVPSVLQGEDEGRDGPHEEEEAGQVGVDEFLAKRHGWGRVVLRGGGNVVEDHHGDGGEAPDRQVDVEAPPPGDVRGEGPAEDGPAHRRKRIHRAKNPHDHRPSCRRHRERHNTRAPHREARAAEPRDGAPDDERGGAGRDAAEQAAEFEDEEGDEEGGLEGEEAVDLARGGLARAHGHEVGGGVPGDVVEAVEVVGDFGDGGADDGLCLLVREVGGEDGVWRLLTWSRAMRKTVERRALAKTTSFQPCWYSGSSLSLWELVEELLSLS
jgi:hypothetical protein